MTILLVVFARVWKTDHSQVKRTQMLEPDQELSIAHAMKRTLQLVLDK